jgi:polyisoprenoid-binding protein YceI
MLTLFALILNSALAAPQDYAFLANKGLLYVKVYKQDTIASAAAHNHAVQANGWSGKATWDPDDLSTCTLAITVPVNNLYADKTETRKIAGLQGEVSESQRKDITKNMIGEGQLNADKYPLITFKSSSCEATGDTVTLKGKFTMRGVTNNISVPVKVNTEKGLQIKGSFKVKATDYGFEPYSAMFGAVANENSMEIHLDLFSE